MNSETVVKFKSVLCHHAHVLLSICIYTLYWLPCSQKSIPVKNHTWVRGAEKGGQDLPNLPKESFEMSLTLDKFTAGQRSVGVRPSQTCLAILVCSLNNDSGDQPFWVLASLSFCSWAEECFCSDPGWSGKADGTVDGMGLKRASKIHQTNCYGHVAVLCWLIVVSTYFSPMCKINLDMKTDFMSLLNSGLLSLGWKNLFCEVWVLKCFPLAFKEIVRGGWESVQFWHGSISHRSFWHFAWSYSNSMSNIFGIQSWK